jgi:hypothetical protein
MKMQITSFASLRNYLPAPSDGDAVAIEMAAGGHCLDVFPPLAGGA